PLYGYLLGFFIWATGQNLFVFYLFQIIVDVFTVLIVYAIGKELWNHKAGLIAAILYSLTSTAIFYTATLLKPTMVASYIALWVLLSIRVPRMKSSFAWIMYGIFLGLGVALRSNLLLLSLSSFILMPLFYWKSNGKKELQKKMILLILGFSIPALMLAARNEHITGQWSVLPPNSGIVLHQLYNSDNPDSVEFAPRFVTYSSPPAILTGYKKEAEKRLEQQLSIYEVSSFWRKQAIAYIASNSDKVIENIIRKSKQFMAFTEIENSRFINAEAMFSPLLKILPFPFGWLFALGFPGLILLAVRNNILSLPILIAASIVFATFIIFIAAGRFRAHGLPLFAVGSGVFITAIIDWKNTGKNKSIALIALSMILGVLTMWNSNQASNRAVNPMEFAWGYLKMGQTEQAKNYALRLININPKDADAYELLGYIALHDNQHEQAILWLGTAAQLAPRHHVTQYNLALSLRQAYRNEESLLAIESAINYAVQPEYLFLKGQVLEEIGDIKNALSTYEYLIEVAHSDNDGQLYIRKAQERLRLISP
ncbi:MAG: tetratricopeptide (TPR) repeat protein, partial [Gammaproteobacteria bacterium]